MEISALIWRRLPPNWMSRGKKSKLTPRKRTAKLAYLKTLQAKVDALRQELGISVPGEITN